MYKCIVTTSWDDGYPQDVRLAKLLKKYGIKSTFYIPTININNTLSDDDIIKISEYHEIGSHTHNHLFLTAVDSDTCMNELKTSKTILESLLGKDCTSFCYPRGMYNAKIKELVQKAGYTCARTTGHFCTEVKDAFEMHPTLHASSYGIVYNLKGSLKLSVFGIKQILGWASFAKKTFDKVHENGGVWHLWGHSWEIEEKHMWNQLEEILGYISRKNNVKYLTNNEVIETILR